jgi:hypothetical protein
MSATSRAAAALLLMTPAWSAGQIDVAVDEANTGTVRFAYDARPGVEICRQGLRIDARQIWWRTRRGDAAPLDCVNGPVEVELEVREGRVTDVELLRLGDDPTPGAVDLGLVPPDEAARYLFSLARSDASRDAASDALLPAVLADVAEVWRDLSELARDRSVDDDVRESALFWLGQEAADAAVEGLTEVARDDDESQEVRDAAIFALSQRPTQEALPVLMELARTGEQPETRRTAMFWLAQVDDERVVRFFEEILLGPPG